MNDHTAVRLPALSAAAVCLLSLLIAYFYMERYLLLAPCPLCILDRFAVGVTGIGFIWLAVAGSHRRLSAWLAWGVSAAGLAAGFVFAARHIWLQNRPPEAAASCLSDNAAAQGLVELVRQAFDADADCGAIMWEFAGLTIPEQVLILFIALAAVQGWLALVLWRLPPAQ